MLGSDKIFLAYPINDNQVYVYAHHVRDRQTATPISKNHTVEMLDLFKGFGGEAPEILASIKENSSLVMSHYLETSRDVIWSKGGQILFIGDASRGFSPMLQNGAAQAFEDA